MNFLDSLRGNFLDWNMQVEGPYMMPKNFYQNIILFLNKLLL